MSAPSSGVFSARSQLAHERNRLSLLLEARPPRFDLSESNPTRTALAYPTHDLLAALDNDAARLYAPDPRGLAGTRAVIAERLQAEGIAQQPDHVFLTSGTSEAYGQLFKLLCDPGDEVLVPTPSYPLFEHLSRLECVTAVPYPLRYDGHWHIDLAQLRAAVSPRTRAILVVSPNNPTGSYLKTDELQALASLGLPIIADEVFTDYPLREDPARAKSALVCEEVLVFGLYGLSKHAALPQWKVSWTCMRGPKALIEPAAARLELISDTYLSVATPTQQAVPRFLELMAKTRDAVHARLLRNHGRLRASISQDSAVSLLDVEGGFYAVLRLPAVQSEERWVLDFLEHDSVHVQPGFFFDFHDEAYVVLSLLTDEATFDEGVDRILRRVELTLR